MGKMDSIKQGINYLLFHSCETTDVGLLSGKMGIVLFFYHYARHTGQPLYAEYADELLDDIFEDIHADTPLDFISGLSGIGWGILYLLKNRFVEGNPDEILSDIDKRLMEIHLPNVQDTSLPGLSGYLYYFNERLAASEPVSGYSMSYIALVREATDRLHGAGSFDLLRFLQSHPVASLANVMDPDAKLDLGLNGIAGWGLKQLLL